MALQVLIANHSLVNLRLVQVTKTEIKSEVVPSLCSIGVVGRQEL